MYIHLNIYTKYEYKYMYICNTYINTYIYIDIDIFSHVYVDKFIHAIYGYICIHIYMYTTYITYTLIYIYHRAHAHV